MSICSPLLEYPVIGNVDAYNFPSKELNDISTLGEADFPLHESIQGNATLGVFKLLFDKCSFLSEPDADRNYPLHVACEEGHCGVINYILKVSTVAVSEQNSNSKLPIELLLESDCDKDDLQYIEALWRLLAASPTAITNIS